MEDQSIRKFDHAAASKEQKVAHGVDGRANVVAVNNSLAGRELDAGVGEAAMKKRRGRPRKYDVDGAVLSSPQSASLASNVFADKHDRGWQSSSSGISPNPFTTFGESVDFDKKSFEVHILNVNLGADIVQPIKSFSQVDVQYVSVLCAAGMVSKVILCQPGCANTLLTYEGCFQILSLNGLFSLGDKGVVAQCKSITLNVVLSKADGEVFGGVVAGPLIAASTTQILIGTLKGSIPNQKNLKRRNSTKLDATTIAAIIDSKNVSKENAKTFEKSQNAGISTSTQEDLIHEGEGKTLNANENVPV